MRILLVDDDTFVSLSLKTILEAEDDIEVVAVGNDGDEAIRLYDMHMPDILLMDIRMAGLSGLEAGEAIINKHPAAKILLLTTFSDDEYIVKALKIGAKGYILKQEFQAIAPALRAVYNGQTVFGDTVINKIPTLMSKRSEQSETFGLTDKEYEVAALVADGLNNKEIAEKLYLSEGTVRNYISTILEKLELRDRTQLAIKILKG